MDGPEVLVPLGFFAMIVAIVVVPVWLKSRERRELQSTLRNAIDKGQPMPAELIEAMTKNVKAPPTAFGDIRTGVVWLAIGVGVAVLGFFLGYNDADYFHPLVGIGSIPAIIGIAYIVLGIFNPNKGQRS